METLSYQNYRIIIFRFKGEQHIGVENRADMLKKCLLKMHKHYKIYLQYLKGLLSL